MENLTGSAMIDVRGIFAEAMGRSRSCPDAWCS
jgi:hypothetical protein